MTFISYAQNFEDVLLWRALGHIKNGFYIDVGANDPVEHSVTKAFYDAGWHGINIEPLPAFHQQFLKQRPRDINLAIAAGAADGSLTLFDVPSVNGWASPDQAVAEAHRADGFEVTELTVPVRTLSGVCAEHVRADIHFLKVDVEGFEGEVLRGMDFETWRPWLLVIEATLPNSRVTNHAAWEALVTDHRYRFAHFDGLNRYYVADEHAELLEVLSIQPNVFDDFITHHLDNAWRATQAADAACAQANQRLAEVGQQHWAAEQRAERADQTASQAVAHAAELMALLHETKVSAEQALAAERARADHVQHTLEQTGAWARDLEQRLVATHNSTSWRVTRPLRALGSLLHGNGARKIKAGTAKALRGAAVRITSSERMRRLLIPIMLRFPNQAAKVSQMVAAIKHVPVEAPPAVADLPDEIRALPASARKVLADLQRGRRTSTGV